MQNTGWMAVLDPLIETHGEERALRLAGHDGVACRMQNTGWMAVLDQLIETHGEDLALRLAGPDTIACRLLDPAYLSMVNEWFPDVGERLITFLDSSAFRWVNLLDFLPFYRDNKKWTQAMTRKLMKGIPKTKTDQVTEDVWKDIYKKRK
jgi:hypothetical protein